VKRWVGAGGALAVAWVMVRSPSLGEVPGEILNGALIGLSAAFIFRRMYPGEFSPSRGFRKLPLVANYVRVFIYELITANIDVAGRVLHPELPIAPRVIEYELEIENDLAITLLANSITLTPGTLTIDHLPERNALKVHAIDGAEDPEGVTEPIEKWEELLKQIFNGGRE
jgi:multicomponent Na+:H+ antiporter subunit E